jgi:hypothetical protein
MEEAVREAVDMAIKAGWSPRRWWQWWRWGEVNPLAALERNP